MSEVIEKPSQVGLLRTRHSKSPKKESTPCHLRCPLDPLPLSCGGIHDKQGGTFGFKSVGSIVSRKNNISMYYQYIYNLPGSLKGTRMYVKEAPFFCKVLRTKSIDTRFTSLISSGIKASKLKT